MAFPAIKYCIICEEAQVGEGAHKLSLHGFYGLSPDANIVAVEWGTPNAFTCVVGLERGAGAFNAATSILDPNNSILVGESTSTFFLDSKHADNVLICSFAPFAFQSIGIHIFRLRINGQIKYRGMFGVCRSTSIELE